MVTIIIPIYNAEPYLRRCLDSVLVSTYQEFELILINDGSTDNSLKICQEYAARDSRILLISQPNGGVSSARNRGLDTSHGEWITFVDADDMISPDFLGMIAQNKFQSQDLLLFDSSQTKEKQYFQGDAPQELHFDNELVYQILLRTMNPHPLVKGGNLNLFTPWAKAFRKDIIDNYSIRFCTDLFFGEDTLFNIEYLLHTKHCAYIVKPVYYYIFYAESVSRRFQPKLPYNMSRQAEKIRNILEHNHMFSSLEQEYWFYVLDNLTYTLIWSVFNPHNPAPYKQKSRLCKEIRRSPLYSQALKHYAAHDQLSLRAVSRWIFCPLFRLRWYLFTAILCKPCYYYLSWKSRR